MFDAKCLLYGRLNYVMFLFLLFFDLLFWLMLFVGVCLYSNFYSYLFFLRMDEFRTHSFKVSSLLGGFSMHVLYSQSLKGSLFFIPPGIIAARYPEAVQYEKFPTHDQ